MQITKKTTALVDVDNLKKLITKTLLKEDYKVNSISFSIMTPDQKKHTSNVSRNSYSASSQFQGATCSLMDLKSDAHNGNLVKVSENTQVTITDKELFTLAKSHLRSEGYEIAGEPEINFRTVDDGDDFYYSSRLEFNGIKCLVNKATKNINIVEE